MFRAASLLIGFAATACAVAPTSSSAQATGHRCAAITDDSARLACYDDAFGQPERQTDSRAAPGSAAAPGTSAAAPVAAAVPAAAAANAPAAAAASAPAAAAPAATTAASAPASAAPAAPVDPTADFGLTGEQIRKREPEKKTPQQVESIDSIATVVSQRKTGEFVYALANGQIWVQNEADSGGWLREGSPVEIRRGMLGSFRLVSGSVATKVRRLQ
jgi:hypothetical protein